MDASRFDTLVASLADAGSSRRSLLARLAAGGFAAALTTLGIGGFSNEDAEAKDSCKKKCKKKNSKQSRKQCKKRCNEKGGGGGSGGGGSAGFKIVNTSDIGEGCTSSATCNTGFCLNPGILGTCQVCDPVLVCGQGNDKQCCIIGADCINGNCVG